MEETQLKKPHKIVLIGGSAGSLDALFQIVPQLQNLPNMALVLVLHRKSAEDTALEDLIAMKSRIPVAEVEDKTPLEAGKIYITPSGYHLLFEKNGFLALDTSEKVNYSRPSIDVSFESAADAYGPSLVGILLSGANTDGTAGLLAIKNAGGTNLAQDPATAEMSLMPANAIAHGAVHFVRDVPGLLHFIKELAELGD